MRSVIEIAAGLADEFRPRAADYDRTGEFPTRNYARMRETGYLRAPVPVELGGGGCSMLEMCHAQEALARGCSSTALAVNMHLFQVGVMADAWRAGQPVEALLRRVAHEGIVLASNGAESIVLGEWTTSTTARRTPDGYLINGRKFFCSQAPGFDIVRFLARDEETGELLMVTAGRGTPGLRIDETWDTTGMRATASHDLVLENVVVHEQAIGARMPAGEPLRTPALQSMYRWFMPMVSSVYLGTAEEAAEEAHRAVGKGINSAHRSEALTDALIGEMTAALITARSVRDQLVAEIQASPRDLDAALVKAVALKEIVVSQSIAAVQKAVEIAGGRSYFRKSPLERLARDVQAGRFHPPSAPVSFQIIGQRMREARSGAS